MTDSPEDFEKLRKLLKLKSYEQPPPGYFNRFSTQVVNRLERADASSGHWSNEVPWLRRFFSLLETNPFAAGAFGVAICGLLVSGITYSQYLEAAAGASSNNMTFSVADSGANSGGQDSINSAGFSPVATSTAPMMGSNVDEFFNGGGKWDVQKASFSLNH